jgi:hypothetical protein
MRPIEGQGGSRRYVYNLGRSGLRRTCETWSPHTLGWFSTFHLVRQATVFTHLVQAKASASLNLGLDQAVLEFMRGAWNPP